MKPNVRLEVPLGAKRVLLHACCAPCSSAVVECLMENGIEPVIFYSNSNIFPKEEYDHRLNECIRYALKWGIPIVDDVYDHEDWGGCAEGLEHEPERGGRCLQCFKYRLLRAARVGRVWNRSMKPGNGPAARSRGSSGGPRTGARVGCRSAGTKSSAASGFTTSSTADANSRSDSFVMAGLTGHLKIPGQAGNDD